MSLSPFIFINLADSICCIIFLLFLFISYFSKKNMDNIDNKIFKLMLISNLSQVVIYTLFYISDIVAFILKKDFLYKIVLFFSKLAPIPTFIWCCLLAIYLIYIINAKNEKFNKYIEKNRKIISAILIAFLGIIILFHILEKTEVNLATGVEPKLLIVINLGLNIAFLLNIIIIIVYRKKIERRKRLTFYMFIFFFLIAAIFGVLGLPIVMTTVIVTATNHLMYHTIENPDLKLINQLQLAKDQAEKSNNAKSDFLSSMSHEIRTPLNAIIGLGSMIQSSDDVNEIHKDMNDIIIASQNLLEIVNGILDINKLESNKMEIVEESYNPREIIDSIIKLINIKIGSKELLLRNNISEDLPHTLYGDKDKIKQIIMNLLTNAVKYTEKGFIDFNIICKNSKDKCELTISVRDTGRGISNEQKEKLFTKFNRLEKDKDSDIEGTGLGLALTKSLVELFEGSITVDSILGQGSTFVVTIPQKIIELKETEEIL